jgi:hypothetical protein
MSRVTKGRLLCLAAILLDVGAPLAATVTFFPAWIEQSATATVSGIFAFLAILSAIPLFRVVINKLKTPSMWMIWLIIFILFFALEHIVSEVKIIALVGFIANLVGAVMFKRGKRLIKEE